MKEKDIRLARSYLNDLARRRGRGTVGMTPRARDEQAIWAVTCHKPDQEDKVFRVLGFVAAERDTQALAGFGTFAAAQTGLPFVPVPVPSRLGGVEIRVTRLEDFVGSIIGQGSIASLAEGIWGLEAVPMEQLVRRYRGQAEV